MHAPTDDNATLDAAPLLAPRWRATSLLLVGLVGVAIGAKHLGREADTRLPSLGRIPEFAMVDQDNRERSSQSLEGSVSLVAFFYATCTTSCPRITANMAGFARRFGQQHPDVAPSMRLVSITLDPENDTPAVLKDYANKIGADTERWSFLSGRSVDLARVVTDGFKVSFERVDPAAGLGSILHGEWIVLVDRHGEIRGYYRLGTIQQTEELTTAVVQLAKEKM